MDKMMEQLHSEVDRLQTLLEIERICHRATKDKLEKAEHDRDRYKARLKEYEKLRQLVAKHNLGKASMSQLVIAYAMQGVIDRYIRVPDLWPSDRSEDKEG